MASEPESRDFIQSRPRVCGLCCSRESIGKFAACLKPLATASNIFSAFASEIFGLPICRVRIGGCSQNASSNELPRLPGTNETRWLQRADHGRVLGDRPPISATTVNTCALN